MSMAREASDASKKAIFAYSLLDFLDRVESEGDILEDRIPGTSVVELPFRTWAGTWPDAPPGGTEGSAGRAWERWKARVASFGFAGFGPNAFELDLRRARRWAEATIKRGIEIAEAYKAATGRTLDVLRAPESDVVRDLSADELARRLGVEIHAVYKWVKLGIPYSRVEGTKGFGDLAFDEKESRAWLAGRMDESRRVASHHEERIPFEEASRRLLAVRDTLGLTNRQIAARIGISLNTLQSWMTPSVAVRTVPLKAVIEAEGMLLEKGIEPSTATPGRREEKRIPQAEAAGRLQSVKDALNLSTTVMAELLGVPTVTLKSWLGTGGKIASTVPTWAVDGAEELMETMEPRVYKASSSKLHDPKLLREAFEKAGGSPRRAAEILGVTHSAAKAAADRLGIETKMRAVLSEVVSKQSLVEALTRHDGSAAAASRDLGVDRPSVLRLASFYGVSDLIRRRA